MMRKTTILIVFSLVISILSIHLPWISDVTVNIPSPFEDLVVERIDFSYWSFMAKKTIYQYSPSENYHWSETLHLLYNQLWGDPPSISSLIYYQIIIGRPLGDLWEGYYVILLFQILTVIFLLVCVLTERWNFSLKGAALFIATFLVSLGAPVVGVNQYSQDWNFNGGVTIGHVGGRSSVQFEIGFYLALASSILILIYAVSSIIIMFREEQ